MRAADAVEHARAALREADQQADRGNTEVSAALVAVADGWTRLAATLAEHPIATFATGGEVTEVHVRNETKGPSEEALLRAGRYGSWATLPRRV